MNIEDKYKSYFSSRGVDPSIYKNARLPYYLRTVFQKGKSIRMSMVLMYRKQQ